MSYEIWWDYFNEDPFEKIGRMVPDAFGNPIVVRLARISWEYLDWLDQTYDRDRDWFFSENHRLHDPREQDLDSWMEGAVNKTFLLHEKKGNPRPAWCPPAPPHDLVDI